MPVRFDEEVWLAHAHRRLVVHEGQSWTILTTASCAAVAIERASGRICCLGDPASGNALLDALVVGPALIFALAERSIFCLHASAASVDGRVRVFLGPSGVGKSTLVADLAACRVPRVLRLTDDILPLSWSADGVYVLPDYPQLKLPASRQQVGDDARPWALDRVFVLTHDAPASGPVAIDPLSTTEATLALVRHTVAAKLFSPALLDRHFDVCAAISASVPVSAVAFERDLDQLDTLRGLLIS